MTKNPDNHTGHTSPALTKRRPVEKSNPANYTVLLSMTRHEHETITRMAAASKMSRSYFIMHTLRSHIYGL